MPIDLDPLEQRLVGVLIEKETTVPESYPLTVNGLVVGSNQKNNREPQMEVQDYEIEGALKSLLMKGWILEHDRDGGRTRRYAHQADTQLGVGKAELALLAELLLRGPQAPGELARRAERMHAQGTPEDVLRRLMELAARPVPYVRQLERRPGERAARWMHLLGARGATSSAPAAAPSGASYAPPAPPAPPRPPSPAPSPAPAPAPAEGHERTEELSVEVERLRERLDTLERRLDRLEGR
jgi:uncharacterized protein YceH (UPF0502 family)